MLRGNVPPRLLGGVLILLVPAALVAGGLALRSAGSPTQDLDRLEDAQGDAETSSEDIAANLERIAANLKEAEGLTETSDEIGALTVRQQRSLKDIADLLRTQLDQLHRTAGTLDSTRASAAELSRISDRQAAAIAEAVAALRDLERFARRAGAVSADVSYQARYGARLAEDSQKSFERP